MQAEENGREIEKRHVGTQQTPEQRRGRQTKSGIPALLLAESPPTREQSSGEEDSDGQFSPYDSAHPSGDESPLVSPLLASPQHPQPCVAVLPSGRKFKMHAIHEMTIEGLFSGRSEMYLSVVGLSAMSLIGIMIFTGFLYKWNYLPLWILVAQAVVWRLAYNVGIGIVLRCQSNIHCVERFYERFIATAPRIVRILENGIVFDDPAVPRYKAEDYPPEYNAWIFFRIVVAYILMLDCTSNAVVGFAVWEDATSSHSALDYLRISLGFILVFIGLAAKSDALRVVGDFAWNWGDFFFLLKKNLVFDGIFQMFPHPMYTIGYAWMYGGALINRSETYFYLCLFSHLGQMLFLVLVETPHMDKIYGKFSEPTEAERIRDEVLYDEENGYLDRREVVGLLHVKLWRVSDLFLVILVVYNTAAAIFILNPWVHVVHCVAWRLFHTVALGWALRRQSMTHCWTEHYFKSPRDAFDNWKHLYNTSATMANMTYVIAAVHLFTWESQWASTWALRQSLIVAGLILLLIHVYVLFSVHEVIGDFGYFYGDFFVENVPVKLNYTGIYRFLNNPESTVGFAGFYGVVLITGSIYMVPLALFSHLCAVLFTKYVEKPHMQRKYGRESMRQHGGFRSTLRERARRFKDDVKGLRQKAKAQMRRYDQFKQKLKMLPRKISEKED